MLINEFLDVRTTYSQSHPYVHGRNILGINYQQEISRTRKHLLTFPS